MVFKHGPLPLGSLVLSSVKVTQLRSRHLIPGGSPTHGVIVVITNGSGGEPDNGWTPTVRSMGNNAQWISE